MAEKKVVLVTGGAGGMGLAIAQEFANNGCMLILCDFHRDRLESASKLFPNQSMIEVIHGDITDANFPARVLSVLSGRKIDVLVNAAGVSPSMASAKIIMSINFNAVRFIVETLLPSMAPGGVTILIASNSGHMFTNYFVDRSAKKLIKRKASLLSHLMLLSPRTAYPLSKRCIQLYAQAMAPAFGRINARILSLSPGIIDTEMGQLEQRSGPEMGRMISLTPLGRMGTAAEIACVATFLASPAASYINGTDILVDGGTIAGIRAAGGLSRLL